MVVLVTELFLLRGLPGLTVPCTGQLRTGLLWRIVHNTGCSIAAVYDQSDIMHSQYRYEDDKGSIGDLATCALHIIENQEQSRAA